MKIASCDDARERYLLRVEFDGIYMAGSPSLWDPNIVAAVVVHGRINIPSIYVVGRIGASLFGLEMYDKFRAWWSEWGSVKIKCAKVVCVGGECRVYPRGTE